MFPLDMVWATEERHLQFNIHSLEFIRIKADVASLYFDNLCII